VHKPHSRATPTAFEALVIALGREFRRRRMTGHLEALRRYYRQRERHKLVQALAEHRAWDENVVIEWLAILRIPPFDNTYVVQSKEASCPRCAARRNGAEVDYRATFPGGSLRECRVCKTAWLVSDRASEDAYARGPGEVEEPKGGRR
jgi:hypothetical protein